ncbi:CyP450 monooxygenase [Stereum hirsutum FP-91666 SS1]|uniref:CyP450 monooxygenase n=1 Tax=Stereum hirsutum (strain FP-91666) TaxID=721885 RepID=UPI0004449F40|nr:CyP450 monooxygenase [Stereum hirsutum FP-91666 SS1]EIM84295.1 CyP450 monooxygenase [Stereum hirsutum FP-91666 SS1]
MPPGPPRLPFIGSLLHMPKSHPWKTYTRWAKEHGKDITHIDVLGSHILVINTAKAAFELFERRGLLYADKPPLYFLNKVIGFDWVMGFQGYSPRWREFRKYFHQSFNQTAAQSFRPLLLGATHELLRRLLDEPDDFLDHLRQTAGRVILLIAYGIDAKSKDDPHIQTAERGLQAVAFGAHIRGQLFDFFPLLLRLPSWFPGATYKAEAKPWKKYAEAMIEDPYRASKAAFTNGTAPPNVTASLLSQLDSKPSPITEDMVKLVPANMYLAGTDTSVSALGTFLLAMTLYPQAQRRAQAEIDAVIGEGGRLPDFSDEASLPYVGAVVKEVLRWRPVGPLALPHCLTQDDTYDGYFLKGGSWVIGNTWAIFHDESIYPDPDTFSPERYFDNPALPYPNEAFGYGRRWCAGKWMAIDNLWITVVSVLATMNVEKARDEFGREIVPKDEYTTGFVV